MTERERRFEEEDQTVEVASISQALSITELRNGNGRKVQFFRVVEDNTPINRCLLKAEARKFGYGVEDLWDLASIPKDYCRAIVVNALGVFTDLFDSSPFCK